MNSSRMVSAFVLVGALLASPAFGQGRPADTTETSAPTSLEGKVTAVERDTGRLDLDTEKGHVTLVATPDQLAGIEVGDLVRVSLPTRQPIE